MRKSGEQSERSDLGGFKGSKLMPRKAVALKGSIHIIHWIFLKGGDLKHMCQHTRVGFAV